MVSTLLATLTLKVILVASFCALYALGGQGHKQFRRIVSPSAYILISYLILLILRQLTPLIASSFLLMFIAANPPVSYGFKFTRDKMSLKILFRGICGLFYGLATSLPIYLLHGTSFKIHAIIALNCLLATVSSIGFGVFNPFPSKWGNLATITEDMFIALSYITILAVVL